MSKPVFVIVAKSGNYLAKRGHVSLYTEYIKHAKIFTTEKEADDNCAGNEEVKGLRGECIVLDTYDSQFINVVGHHGGSKHFTTHIEAEEYGQKHCQSFQIVELD